jgi:transposase
VSASEIITRRRKWSAATKASLLAEVEAEGGKVGVVARRHGISESVIYGWRSADKASGSQQAVEPVTFVPLGVVGGVGQEMPALLASPEPQRPPLVRAGDSGAGAIEIALPNGARISVDAFVNETALARVLRAMKRST